MPLQDRRSHYKVTSSLSNSGTPMIKMRDKRHIYATVSIVFSSFFLNVNPSVSKEACVLTNSGQLVCGKLQEDTRPNISFPTITGTWKWRCCEDKYFGYMELFQDRNLVTGKFYDQSNGQGGDIDGVIRQNSVEFTRNYSSGSQFFRLVLSSDGQNLEGSLSGSRDQSVGTRFVANRQK